MRSVTRGAWRSVRCLLLVICAGGILAADDTWISAINLDFVRPSHWFSSTAASAEADLPAAMNVSVDIAPRARISMSGLLHGLLFDRPAGRWALDLRAADTLSSLPRRLVEFDQINTIFGGDNSFSYQRTASFSPILAAPSPATTTAELSPDGPSAVTASGNWISNASGNWGDAGNWQGGVIADGAGNMAHFDALDITTDVTVSLDTSRTIGELYIGDTNSTHRYSISSPGATSLTFDSGVQFVHSVLQQASTSAGDTIAAPLLLNSDLDVNNLSPSNPFQITGNIASSGGPSSFQNLWFNNATGAAGEIRVSGNISNGTGEIGVIVVGGTVIFTGTNTYGGSTSVDGGLLLINGDNSGATATVFVGSGGTLGGTGTVGGDVQTFDGTITGATPSTVGTLTLLGNVDLSTGEGDGTYLANLSGSLSDLLAITGTLGLGQGSILDIDGAGDGITTYTLATFASRDDVFGTVMDIPVNYTLVYHDTDIQLVPIPEPSTWIAGALALAAIGWISRRSLWRGARAA
jgi:autotransporter-associated beta strand protein